MTPPSIPSTWGEALREAVRTLSETGVDAPAREARLLLSDVLRTSAAEVIGIEDEPSSPTQLDQFRAAVDRRAKHTPLSRIRGWREFYGRRFAVTDDVLDPRPETEHLVEEGLKRLPPGGRVLELGVGSGCVLLTLLLEQPLATGVGVERSPGALKMARTAAEEFEVQDRVRFIEGCWEAALGEPPFDLIVSNPPYIPTADIADLAPEVRDHDPRMALDGGPDGLDAYRAIVPLASQLLAAGGWLVLEVGAGQAGEVRAMMAMQGLKELMRVNDLAGHARVVLGRRPG